MKKKLFSATAAGMLLLASTGATAAIISTPTGVSAFLTITGFEDASPSTYTATFTFATPPTGFTQTINFTDTTLTNGHVKLVIPPGNVPGTGTPPFIDISATGPVPPLTNFVQPIFFPSGAATIFAGSANADFPVDSLTFDGVNTPGVGNGQFSFTYNGVLSLFGVLLNNPAFNAVINGSLSGSVSSVTPSSLAIDFTENCNTAPPGPVNGLCIYELLHAFNMTGSTPGDSKVTAAFGFPAGTELVVPEPASLALMGIGIAGLGFIRRRKAA